jgi:hypothetical protein
MKLRGYAVTKIICLSVALAACAVMIPATAFAADKCGVAAKVNGSVRVARGATESALYEGGELYEGDVIMSGQTGYVEMKLVDDTLIAMGGNGAITLLEVQFKPGGQVGFGMSIGQGVVWVSTGSIGLVKSEAVKFTTPSAIISSGNATLQFTVGSGREELKVQWIPKGGKVSVIGTKSRQSVELTKPDVTISLAGANAMSVISNDVSMEQPKESDAGQRR